MGNHYAFGTLIDGVVVSYFDGLLLRVCLLSEDWSKCVRDLLLPSMIRKGVLGWSARAKVNIQSGDWCGPKGSGRWVVNSFVFAQHGFDPVSQFFRRQWEIGWRNTSLWNRLRRDRA